jgi:hypothetical protein
LQNESDSAKDGYVAKYLREPSAEIVIKTAMKKFGNWEICQSAKPYPTHRLQYRIIKP